MEIAKLFTSGPSQAVRLAEAFRFEGAAVILEPLEAGWDWLERCVGSAGWGLVGGARGAGGAGAAGTDRFW